MDQGDQDNQVRPMKREIDIYYGEYKIVISRLLKKALNQRMLKTFH